MENRAIVLLVEDNQGDVYLIREAMKHHQIDADLRVMNDGEKAISFVDEMDGAPNAAFQLAILDLNLPRRGGMEVLECIRSSKTCREIAVLMVSSSESPRDREETAALGANAFFTKPSGYEAYLRIGKVINELLKKPCLDA